MDFNTGGGSRRPDDDRPLFDGEAGGRPARGPAGGPGGEFNFQDPINSFISTVRNVVLDPVGFFRGMAKRGDFVNPIVFALICYEISTLLGGLVSLLFSGLLGLANVGNQGFGAFGGAAGSVAGFIISLIIAPIIGAIILFIAAGIFHLLTLLIIGAGNSGFEATTRVVSYSFVYQLVGWIPIIGWIIGPIYGIFLSIIGIREVHATTTGRAAAVVLIPVAVALLIVLIVVIIAFFLLGTALFFSAQPQIK